MHQALCSISLYARVCDMNLVSVNLDLNVLLLLYELILRVFVTSNNLDLLMSFFGTNCCNSMFHVLSALKYICVAITANTFLIFFVASRKHSNEL